MTTDVDGAAPYQIERRGSEIGLYHRVTGGFYPSAPTPLRHAGPQWAVHSVCRAVVTWAAENGFIGNPSEMARIAMARMNLN
jgi:hypothetical protein